jgi:hypothetical protein
MTSTAHVRALLEMAGVEPTEEEVTTLVDAFPDLRMRIERLWAADLGESEPALVFRAAETYGPPEVARA